MSTTLAKIALKAKENPKLRFTSLAHLLTPEFLKETWKGMNKSAVEGMDGETIDQFNKKLDSRIQEIVDKLKAKKYRAPMKRRVDIPKGNGKTRPIEITTVEDRLVQRAVARILNTILEQDYLQTSYGYRTGLKPHDALRVLRSQIMFKKVNYVYEADIKEYFTRINREWLRKMLRERIVDGTLLRLIGKWLRVGVMSERMVSHPKTGTPQGGPISCVLANLYLHYVLDLWFEKVFKPSCQAEAYIIRYVDDFVCCFQYRRDAEKFNKELKERMQKFDLEIAPEKTRLLKFGRFAAEDLSKQSTRPSTFTFLGFEHICGKDRSGKYALIRKPSKKSCRKFTERVKEWLSKHIHWKPKAQAEYLAKMLNGLYEYFGLHHCVGKLKRIHKEVMERWRKTLGRRSQRSRINWVYLKSKSWFSLPRLQTCRYPEV